MSPRHFRLGHNEMLIGRTLEGRRDQVLLSVNSAPSADPTGAGAASMGVPRL